MARYRRWLVRLLLAFCALPHPKLVIAGFIHKLRLLMLLK